MKTKIEHLVTCEEYAKMVGVTRAWIDALTRRKEDEGGIRPVFIGKHRFIDLSKNPPKKFKKQ